MPRLCVHSKVPDTYAATVESSRSGRINEPTLLGHQNNQKGTWFWPNVNAPPYN